MRLLAFALLLAGAAASTKLHGAAERGDTEAVRKLVAEGTNLEALDDDHYTALHLAVCAVHSNPAPRVLRSWRSRPPRAAPPCVQSRALHA